MSRDSKAAPLKTFFVFRPASYSTDLLPRLWRVQGKPYAGNSVKLQHRHAVLGWRAIVPAAELHETPEAALAAFRSKCEALVARRKGELAAATADLDLCPATPGDPTDAP